MNKQILLSISILVSGRESTTNKCIDSLDRLRKRVPSELILVDTGCSEEMRQWLNQRADKVISFQWCNDFAAARNAGLQEASGEWFMFLDDDEWFEGTSRLERFFLSGEYQGYASASYIIRNYIDMEGQRWQDVPLPRMVRRNRGTRFVYPVHEMLWPRYEPVKCLEDYVHHYGYASADPETQKEKHQRNLSLLLPAIEIDPYCLHHYLQAVMEYIAMEDFASALQMAENGIQHYVSDRMNDGYLGGLYAAAVKTRVLQRQYEEAGMRGKELLMHGELSRLAKASIYGDLVIAWSALTEQCMGKTVGKRQQDIEETGNQDVAQARYQEAAECLKKYLQAKQYFSAHPGELSAQQTLILDQCFEVYHYQMIMGWGFASALFSQKAAAAEALLQQESIAWWMEAVQNWYTYTSEQFRERWKTDFQAMVAGGRGQYPKTRQLYDNLTAPAEAGEETHAQKAGRQKAGEQESECNREAHTYEELSEGKSSEMSKQSMDERQAARTEMEALAAKLKVQIRFLIEQHQEQAALSAIRQVLQFLPMDEELLELLHELEGR